MKLLKSIISAVCLLYIAMPMGAQRVDFVCNINDYLTNNSYTDCKGSIEFGRQGFDNFYGESGSKCLFFEAGSAENDLVKFVDAVYPEHKYGFVSSLNDFSNNGYVKRRDTYSFFNMDENVSTEIFTIIIDHKPESIGIRHIIDGKIMWMAVTPWNKALWKQINTIFRNAQRGLKLRWVKIGQPEID